MGNSLNLKKKKPRCSRKIAVSNIVLLCQPVSTGRELLRALCFQTAPLPKLRLGLQDKSIPNSLKDFVISARFAWISTTGEVELNLSVALFIPGLIPLPLDLPRFCPERNIQHTPVPAAGHRH